MSEEQNLASEFQPQQQSSINPDEWEEFHCPKCGCILFDQRTISLRSKVDPSKFRMAPVFVCDVCKHILPLAGGPL